MVQLIMVFRITQYFQCIMSDEFVLIKLNLFQWYSNSRCCYSNVSSVTMVSCQDAIYPMKYAHDLVLFCYVLFPAIFIFLWFMTSYSVGLLRWHWGNHMIAPVSAKQPWKNMDRFGYWCNRNEKHKAWTMCILRGKDCTCVTCQMCYPFKECIMK